MQMQLQLSGTGNNLLELAIIIMQNLKQRRTQKLIHRSSQNTPLPPRTDQTHQTPKRTIKSHIKPATIIQRQE